MVRHGHPVPGAGATAVLRATGSPAPTPKVLTQTLRALERDGLITRTIYAEVPARVEYELTALGHTLLEFIAASQRWAEDHMPTLLAARDAYENHNTGMG